MSTFFLILLRDGGLPDLSGQTWECARNTKPGTIVKKVQMLRINMSMEDERAIGMEAMAVKKKQYAVNLVGLDRGGQTF